MNIGFAVRRSWCLGCARAPVDQQHPPDWGVTTIKMRRPKVSRKSETASPVATGPYDFALYVSKSLGRSLPLVVIVGLIAYGVWYAMGEMSVLQTRIIDGERQKSEAEIKKAKAEADAKAAADKARYESLLEYSKQLTELNTVSADVSKRLQDLVSGQIDNMKEANELAEVQD